MTDSPIISLDEKRKAVRAEAQKAATARLKSARTVYILALQGYQAWLKKHGMAE